MTEVELSSRSWLRPAWATAPQMTAPTETGSRPICEPLGRRHAPPSLTDASTPALCKTGSPEASDPWDRPRATRVLCADAVNHAPAPRLRRTGLVDGLVLRRRLRGHGTIVRWMILVEAEPVWLGIRPAPPWSGDARHRPATREPRSRPPQDGLARRHLGHGRRACRPVGRDDSPTTQPHCCNP